MTSATEKTADEKKRQRRPVSPRLKRGAYLQTLAALLWLPQAGAIAFAVGNLAATGFDASLYYCAAAVFLIGCLRSLLDAAGAALAFDAARAVHAHRHRMMRRAPAARRSTGRGRHPVRRRACWPNRRKW